MNIKRVAVYLGIGAILALSNVAIDIKIGRNIGIIGMLCNSLTVPGILLTGSGVIWKAVSLGIFDIFGYGLRSIIGYGHEHETYGEYVLKKRGKSCGAHELLAVGIGFLVLAVLLCFYV